MQNGIDAVWQRIQGYLGSEPFAVLFELAVIWVVVYLIVRFLKGTRGARVVWGVALIMIVGTLTLRIFPGGSETLERLNFLYTNVLAFISFVLVIVFQPELRRALVRIGEGGWFGRGGLRRARVVEELVASVDYLARNKIGGLIAIERQVGLKGIVEAGIRLDAEVSRQLLNTLFWPGSALHDMGVVIRGDRIVAAGVQFPLAEGNDMAQELGSRHRAAVGLSNEADALIIVVSEETGKISIAERGQLRRGLTVPDLRSALSEGMNKVELDDRPVEEADTPIAPKESDTGDKPAT
ncbi:MAG: diadenylate cyclase CdaA [Phycisphaeraceae bacterium]|nr:diadenylate cyclase CdaA [Phycisphaeraceae bacterium]